MRLFVALNPDDATRVRLAALGARLEQAKADVRWVDAEQYHVTIKFMKDFPEERLGELMERLDKAAREVPVFPLDVEGAGRFPERGDARVIVAHVRSPDMRLVKLHRLIDEGIGGMGLEMDMRPLVPHVTLGRVQTNHGVNRLLRRITSFADDFLGRFEVSEAVLYQSTLGPGGAKHEVLHSAKLQAVSGD